MLLVLDGLGDGLHLFPSLLSVTKLNLIFGRCYIQSVSIVLSPYGSGFNTDGLGLGGVCLKLPLPA